MIAGTTAPWWAIPVVAGSFALLGVVFSQSIALINERRRDRRRLDDEVRSACIALLTSARSYDLETVPKQPRTIAMENEPFVLRLMLVAPKSVSDAAWALLNDLMILASNSPDIDRDATQAEKDQYRGTFHESFDALVNATRRHFGLPSV